MHRTQLYLDDDLWRTLHARAKLDKTTVSELVRQAARQKYMYHSKERKDGLMGIVGLWKDRDDLSNSEAYIRNLRKSTRGNRLNTR